MLLYVWLITLIILLAICRCISRKRALTPEFCFIACFVPQALYATAWTKDWNFDMSFDTYIALIIGTGSFVLISLVVKKFARVYPGFLNGVKRLNYKATKKINANTGKLCLFAAFQIFIFMILAIWIKRLYPGSSVPTAIGMFKLETQLSTVRVEVPYLANRGRGICIASGYIWIYFLVRGFIYKEKNKKLLLVINTILSILNSVVFGSRGELVSYIVAAVIMFYYIYENKYNWKKHIKRKYIFRICVIMLLILVLFPQIGKLMGREQAWELNEYIAIYLSAQLKNLDVFISKGKYGSQWADNQTLYELVNFYARHFGHIELWHKPIGLFYYVNNHSLGNVSTIFFPFMYDAGYIGVFVFSSIMACITQVVYLRIINKKEYISMPISLLAFSYMMYTVMFAFFSEKFYSEIITTNFIYTLLYWLIIKKYLEVNILI